MADITMLRTNVQIDIRAGLTDVQREQLKQRHEQHSNFTFMQKKDESDVETMQIRSTTG